jgi:hypothetical protein
MGAVAWSVWSRWFLRMRQTVTVVEHFMSSCCRACSIGSAAERRAHNGSQCVVGGGRGEFEPAALFDLFRLGKGAEVKAAYGQNLQADRSENDSLIGFSAVTRLKLRAFRGAPGIAKRTGGSNPLRSTNESLRTGRSAFMLVSDIASRIRSR